MMLSYPEAVDVVRHYATEIATAASEPVAISEALGRSLARPLIADRDQPPFNRSTRDGYAVRAADMAEAVTIAGLVRAGERYAGELPVNGCVEIMTGAPVPAEADCVVMLEHVTQEGSAIRMVAPHSAKAGANIVLRASEAKAGDVLLPAGGELDAAAIAIAATCGLAQLNVYRQPTVAILGTGDELVDIGEQPTDYQIRNSNSYALAALVRKESAIPLQLAIAADTMQSLHSRIAEARQAELLLLSGGVSKGKYDLVEDVLAELDAEFFFTSVAIQPGKPVVFGRLPATKHHAAQFFFGLPGNPVSTHLTFLLFVKPFLAALRGAKPTFPQFASATLTHEIKTKTGLTRFLPAVLSGTYDGCHVSLTSWQGSGDLAANLRANCYAVLPPDRDLFQANETVTVLLR